MRSHEEKFDAIRARVLTARERLDAFEQNMLRKYGQMRPPDAWLTRTEDAKRESIYAAQSKAWDAMFALLTDISPRAWGSKVAAWWVVEHLTYADAITSGPLSAVPQVGYGTTAREVERFSEAA